MGNPLTRVSEVREHSRVQSKDKPLSCTECTESFTTSGEKPFSCSWCDYSFSSIPSQQSAVHTGDEDPTVVLCLPSLILRQESKDTY